MKLSFAILSVLVFTLATVAKGLDPAGRSARPGWKIQALSGAPSGTAPAGSHVPEASLQAAGQAQLTGQAQSLLLKIFLVSARTHDLLGLIETSRWKMTDAEKSAFEQLTGSVQNEMQTLEKWRYQFQYHPDDADAGGKTLEALGALLPDLENVAQMINQFGSATEAEQLKQAAGEMSGLRANLTSYLETRFPIQFRAPAPAAASATAPSQQIRPPAPPSGKAAPASQPSAQTGAVRSVQRQAAEAVKIPYPSPSSAKPASQPAPPAVRPDQMKALLHGVFLADARVSDLLSVLQPGHWKMPDSERALFNERVQSVETQLKVVEKWRYQFLYNLQKPELGESTASALGDLVPLILSIETAVGHYESSADAAQFAQADRQLAAARNSVRSYAASLEAQSETALAAAPTLPGGKTLETERISVPAAAPPVSSLVVAAPPLTVAQVKSILQKVYESEFRIQDLLGQEQPDTWKTASPDERTLAAQARTTLLSRLRELEKWRQLFSQNPANMYYAFQTYRAVDGLFRPLRVFGSEAGEYENESMAGDYSSKENEMEAQLNGLVPYISFILQLADRNIEAFQTDLASCQNQLSYAMHSFVRPAQPMKNIVPVFQGRRTRRVGRQR